MHLCNDEMKKGESFANLCKAVSSENRVRKIHLATTIVGVKVLSLRLLFVFFFNFRTANQISIIFTTPECLNHERATLLQWNQATPKIPKISKRSTLLKEYKAIAASRAVTACCYIFAFALMMKTALKMRLMFCVEVVAIHLSWLIFKMG